MILAVHIVHFNPIERYPPAMNMVRTLAQQGITGVVYTTGTPSGFSRFSYPGFKIRRFGAIHRGKGLLYTSYLLFNLGVWLHLLVSQSRFVLCYEVFSVIPTYLYKLCLPQAIVFIHYHEYVSPEERFKLSSYLTFLFRVEKKLLRKVYWVSQTNADRMALFLTNIKPVKPPRTEIMPNFPPSDWYNLAVVGTWYHVPLRFVYVGAVHLETTHVRAFAKWINRQNGQALWDVYSDNIETKAFEFLQNESKLGNIRLKGRVPYDALPEVLKDYDIGIVFYTGRIPNYIYNAPNKLFEYMACGLDVWVGRELIGCREYIRQDVSPRVYYVDFAKLQQDPFALFEAKKPPESQRKYTAESAFEPLVEELKKGSEKFPDKL